jgi:SpoVK/Ycf46/Vps4 family AAA+-type ATPase
MGLAKLEVMPQLEAEFKKDVDDMIKIELDNIKAMGEAKAKKKKKGKKKKGKKKKKKKSPWAKLPGYKKIAATLAGPDGEKELLLQLIQDNIVKKIPVQSLSDFIGEFNYIHSMLDDIKEAPYDPSMALIRQLVTEYIIFPLGSELVKARFPEMVRCFLFYGPPSTGKTLIVRAIVHETNSIFFDLSKNNIPPRIDAKSAE